MVADESHQVADLRRRVLERLDREGLAEEITIDKTGEFWLGTGGYAVISSTTAAAAADAFVVGLLLMRFVVGVTGGERAC